MTVVPTFETERLFLKDISELDAPSYQKYFSNPEVLRFLSGTVPVPYPDGEALKFIRGHLLPNQGQSRWTWGIFLRQDPEDLIGSITIRREAQSGQRGFWLGQPFWGKGIMSEALLPITDYVFSELSFDELRVLNAPENIASSKIKKSQGYAFLGLEPCSFVDRSLTQAEVWRVTKRAWQNYRALTNK